MGLLAKQQKTIISAIQVGNLVINVPAGICAALLCSFCVSSYNDVRNAGQSWVGLSSGLSAG